MPNTFPRTTKSLIALVAFLAAGALTLVALSQDPTLTGFTDDRAASQLACEARFLELPRSESFREHLRTITENPHPAGSAAQARVGEYLARAMESAGLDVTSHPYDVYLPELTDDVEVHIVTPVAMQLSNREPALDEDRFSGHPDLLNGWNAFSGSGDVTGEVVYANFGRREDYRALDSMGISLAGKVVIARYGGNFRGYKVKFAEERDAAGVILFNDPGSSDMAAYPEGPMMNGQTIQRGSVLTLPWTGDPLTPFVPALPVDGDRQVERLDPSEVPLHTIPVLPIGYEAASEILSRMTGAEAPADWDAGVELDYRLTGGPDLTVRVRVNQPKGLVRATNVVGTIRGSEFPDEWFILGAHYDPWGFGAIDPNGGTAMLLTLAEALGELARDEECRPRRSIMIAHWDAEEYGIIGSTEWAELHADGLQANAVAYINTDGNGRGLLNMGGSHTLERFINAVARDVTDPQTGISVSERLHARRLTRGASDDLDAASDHPIAALGSGSDYTPFLQHLGIASLNLSYSGESGGGSYHSVYDSYDHYVRFGDPAFAYGIALASTAGRAVLRLAEADILPFVFAPFSDTVARYVDEVIELTGRMREETARTNRLLADGRYEAAADPTTTFVPPAREDPVPYLNFAPLQNAVARLQVAAAASDRGLRAAVDEGVLSTAARRAVNRRLLRTERLLTRDAGLPRRPWFRHQIYAPGFYTGYGVKTLPGVREAIEQRAWNEASEQVGHAAAALERLAAELDAITAELAAAAP